MEETHFRQRCSDGAEGGAFDGLTKEEEAAVAAFRKYTLLPLDDCLYALQPSIPHLTRSSLHRCLQRHGISRLPEVEGDKAKKQKFATYPIGYFHIDIAEVQTEDGKLYMFVAVDRASKFAYAELHPRATRTIAKDFLDNLTKAVPYKIHTVLTDNGIQFTKREGTEAYWVIPFDRLCDALRVIDVCRLKLTRPRRRQAVPSPKRSATNPCAAS